MKKIIPALALIGGIAAFAIYKLKKEEEKKIIDLDEGLLEDEDVQDDGAEETPADDEATEETSIEEAPVEESSEEDSKIEEVKEAVQDVLEKAEEVKENIEEEIKDVVEDAKKKAEILEKSVGNASVDDVHDEKYHHLLKSEVASLKELSLNTMAELEKNGDVHEHERPIQHNVVFKNADDLAAFRNTVINRGFVITKGEDDLELQILHIAPVVIEKLMKNVCYIADVAKEYHGVYKGWKSKAMY